ncbi:MAG TPA: DUF418 domain-containing protein [Blastocatellia bacterium]|nr:DUF418 domain-containing protein [Blastocatellia bacterium]
METSSLPEPIQARERIKTLDILRGVAVLGILLVNMGGYSRPEYFPVGQVWPGLADHAVTRLILFFAQGKFVTLFSLLFGVGMAVQMERVEARGGRFVPLYVRRLLVLLLVGLAHGLLLWDGDILHTYAVCGFVLLLLRRRSPKTLLVTALACWALTFLLYAAVTGVSLYQHFDPRGASIYFTMDPADDEKQVAQELRVYTGGTFGEMVGLRAGTLLFDWVADPFVLALLLLGLYIGRRGILQDVAAHEPFLRRVRWRAFWIGLAGNLLFAIGGSIDPSPVSVRQSVGALCALFAAPSFSFCYAATLALLAQTGAWRRRLAPLAAVGQTALTNYLLQSLVCTTIFYGYGLKLYGSVRPVYALLLTLAIYAAQVWWSGWWLRRYRFGPVEWLWRSLTYGRRQPWLRAG